MTDALSMLSAVFVALLGLVVFDLAALHGGADTRESYEDDHRRTRGGRA